MMLCFRLRADRPAGARHHRAAQAATASPPPPGPAPKTPPPRPRALARRNRPCPARRRLGRFDDGGGLRAEPHFSGRPSLTGGLPPAELPEIAFLVQFFHLRLQTDGSDLLNSFNFEEGGTLASWKPRRTTSGSYWRIRSWTCDFLRTFSFSLALCGIMHAIERERRDGPGQ